MATKSQVQRIAKKLGVTVEENSTENSFDVTLTAPPGHRMNSSGSHSAVTNCNAAPGWKPQFWADVLEDLTPGIFPCDDRGDFDCIESECFVEYLLTV